ncbi:MAG: NAD-dependent epimerase/dehydratase family protein [Gemmatimonadales bacterium]|nr:NAD-dependent epimerase/dehydratase family protein [Gemmatimonadales bacterium]
MTRVVVTGAAGFIGSHLSDALVARGADVVGVDNFDAFYGRDAKERNLAAVRTSSRFEFHELDVLDARALSELMTRDGVVVHLAARAGVRQSIADPAGYARVNVVGTAAVADAMRMAGATRLVFGSSSSVYGDATPVPFREDAAAIDPVSPYGATKRSGELLLQAAAPIYGLRVASLRFFTVFGPRQRPDLAIHAFARRIVAGEALTLFGDGTQARDYTYCDDIVAGILAAIDWTATAPPGIEHFNLGGDHPVALPDMVAELERALGLPARAEWLPMQPGDVQRTSADLTKSRTVLGYAPGTSFSDGMRRFVRWFRETHELAN